MTSGEAPGGNASSPGARRYLMIGAPVTAVRTPPLLVDHLAGRGVAAVVETRYVTTADLDAFMRAAKDDASLDGVLVTMPHKKTIIPYLDALSDVAKAAGSVNAVKRSRTERLVGAQFDGIGLVEALRRAGAPLKTSRVLLAGVGGAGLAIAQAIAAEGCRRLAIMDTNISLRDEVTEALSAGTLCPIAAVSWTEGETYDLLINATPLGMRAGDPSPFEPEVVGRARLVADIVADPPRTRLAELAAEAGVALVTGRDMVRGQVGPIGDWLLGRGIQQADANAE